MLALKGTCKLSNFSGRKATAENFCKFLDASKKITDDSADAFPVKNYPNFSTVSQQFPLN